jgi:transcriptional regulator with PAS, ATPase and Fis domain
MVPVTISKIHDSEHKSFANEREILYQVLFDMKKDISDLKQTVKSIIDESMQHQSTNVMPVKYESFVENITIGKSLSNDNDILEATEYEESALSISEVEKDMISKALERYNGKRKMAAKELGISERTLYRKIKEYDL